MSGPTSTKKERTRNSLLVAVQELLLDPEVTAVSVPQIVERAGVAQGTFYNYFVGLPEAIDAVGVLVLLEHARVLGTVIEGVADHTEVVARSAKQTLMLTSCQPSVGRMLFESGVPIDLLISGMRAHLVHDLTVGVDAGVFSVDDLEVASTIYVGTVVGASLDLYRGRLEIDAIPSIVAFLLRLFGVNARKAERLAAAPQEFAPWRTFPLSSLALE